MAVGGLFVEVGMMLVEGRMSGTAPGPPKPGPHCPQLPPAVVSQSSHICNESNHLCARAEALRRHMSLLSESRVPMCIEFYLCADCVCGRSRAAISQPASTDLLLEQWTVTFNKSNGHQPGGANILVEGKSLLAAIRSQLHFSQLSAWYSRHGGAAVPPVCYRLTHPAPGPPPPFHRPPVEHVFPTARVHPSDFLKVSMKALPRLDSIPAVVCITHGTCGAACSAIPEKVEEESIILGPAPLMSSPQSARSNKHRPSTNSSRPANCQPLAGDRICVGGSIACHSGAPSPRSMGSRPPPPANQSHSNTAPSASQAAQATITAFRTVFAELGHCLLDPPSRIPPLKQGFLAWRERRSQVVSSQPQSRTSTSHNGSNSSSTSRKQPSIGMVDDRMQCGCKHIGKHHCEEPLDTDQESNNHISTNINSVCDNKERRKSSCSPPPPLPSNDLNSTRQLNSPSLHHCGNCREKELNRANARHGRSCSGSPLDGCATTCIIGGGGCATGRDGCSAAGRGEICTSSVVPTTPPQIILTPACQTQPNPLKRKRQQETSNSKKLFSDRQSDLHQAFNSQQLVDIFRRLDIRSTDHLPRANLDIKKTVDDTGSFTSESSSPLTSSPLTCSPLTISPLTPSPLATSPFLSSPSPNKKSGWTDSSSDDTENESPSRHTLPEETKVCPAAISSVSLPTRGLHPSLAKHRKSPSGPLLGSLEESLLKRRLRPDRIVKQGYTADLGASGSFCPKHLTLPVTMEFYPPMGLSTPLLGSTVVGKKGYSVPRSGTIQATLLNPHGNVVKMFVVPYQLEDMPPNSMTFLRQRITCATQETACPLLRYLIHLRFSSSKSGRIYLEGEISMLVCRQYDADATLGLDPLDSNSHLTSVIVSPHNPKYSPRK